MPLQNVRKFSFHKTTAQLKHLYFSPSASLSPALPPLGKEKKGQRHEDMQGRYCAISFSQTQQSESALLANSSPFFFVFQLTPVYVKNSQDSNEKILQPPSTLTVKGIQSSLLHDTNTRLSSCPICCCLLFEDTAQLPLADEMINQHHCNTSCLKLPWDKQGSDQVTLKERSAFIKMYSRFEAAKIHINKQQIYISSYLQDLSFKNLCKQISKI